MVSSLIQIVYVSTACKPFGDNSLEGLLEQFRVRNARESITGLLIHREGNFLQAIEGPPGSVTALMGRIRRDPRHHEVVELWRRFVDHRDFGAWTMNYRRVGPDIAVGGRALQNLEALILGKTSLTRAPDAQTAEAVSTLLDFVRTHDAIDLPGR